MYQEIADFIKVGITGRIATWEQDLIALMMAVSCNGDHLEIGVLFGGTLIAAALAKKIGG
jgi:hypothetical protein